MPGAFELVGVGIAADHNGGALGQAQIALAQRTRLRLARFDDCPMHQPRVVGCAMALGCTVVCAP